MLGISGPTDNIVVTITSIVTNFGEARLWDFVLGICSIVLIVALKVSDSSVGSHLVMVFLGDDGSSAKKYFWQNYVFRLHWRKCVDFGSRNDNFVFFAREIPVPIDWECD